MMYNTWVLLRSEKNFYFDHAERCYGNLAYFSAIFEVRFRFYIKFGSYRKFQNFEIPSENFQDFALCIPLVDNIPLSPRYTEIWSDIEGSKTIKLADPKLENIYWSSDPKSVNSDHIF